MARHWCCESWKVRSDPCLPIGFVNTRSGSDAEDVTYLVDDAVGTPEAEAPGGTTRLAR
jgi:hypothetical protein